MKKRDYVADDAVGTSVPQNRVTETLWTVEFFLSTQYMYIDFSIHQTNKNMVGEIKMVNKIQWANPQKSAQPH
jgi:hypothetical protein